MPDTQVLENEKLENFRENVNRRIDLQIEEIQSEAKQKAATLLKEANDNALEKAFDKIQAAAKIARSEYTKDVTLAESDCRQKILKHREETVESIFTELRKKVIDFAKSSKYKDYMLKKLKNVTLNEGAVILISEKDKALIPELKKVVNVEFEFDTEIKIGGFSIKNGAFIENFSLDQALDDQRREFSKNYTLS